MKTPNSDINNQWVFKINGKLPLPDKDVDELIFVTTGIGNYGCFNLNDYDWDNTGPEFVSFEHTSPSLQEVNAYLILPDWQVLQDEVTRLNKEKQK